MDDGWKELAELISKQLRPGPRVAAVGSASLHHPDTESTCEELGRLLAAIPGLILITGGVGGVGATIGKSYFRERRSTGQPSGVFHILPDGVQPPNYGQTFFAGADMRDRREVVGRLSSIYMVVEGGPGTAHETRVAQSCGAILIPAGRSGGHAAALYQMLERPAWADSGDWQELGKELSEPRKVAQSLSNLTAAAICERLLEPVRLIQQGTLTLDAAWPRLSACLPDEGIAAFLTILSPQQRRILRVACLRSEPIREPLTPAPLPFPRGEGTGFSDRDSDIGSGGTSADTAAERLACDNKYNCLVACLRNGDRLEESGR